MENGAIDVSGLVKTFGGLRGRSTASTCRSRRARCTASSGPNGAGKSTTIRVLLGLLRADSGDARLLGGDPWHDAVALHRRLAYVPGDVNLWPNAHRRRGDRPARPPARRPRPGPAGGAARALRARPDQEGPRLLEGQPPEGGAGRRARLRRRAARARRADVGARPAHGGGVPGRASRRRASDGRTVLLSSHILAEVEALCDRVTHHPRRAAPSRPARCRAAPPDPHLDQRRDRAGRRRASAGSPASTTSTSTATGPASTSTRSQLDDDAPAARRARRAQPDEPAADARGAVPAPLRRRDRMSELAGAGTLLRFALRRDRIRIPVYLAALRVLVADTAAQRREPVPDARRRAPTTRRPSTGQPRPDRDGRARRYALRHVGGEVAWQLGGFGAVVRRADEHVPRRPPHARRGAERPQRAGPRGAGRRATRR